MSTHSTSTHLRIIVRMAGNELAQFAPDETEPRPAPGKWSKKELLGHLIDSGLNNLNRFIRASTMDNLIFEGYDQDGWVVAQQYQSAEWTDLVSLWVGLNLQLARVIEGISKEVRYRQHTQHSFHSMAFKTIPEDEATTLNYLIVDYVGHLEYHLAQLIEDYDAIGPVYSNTIPG